MVSPLRAVVTAHAQGSFNRVRKEFGDLRLVTAALFLGAVAIITIVPVTMGLTLMGYEFGVGLAGGPTSDRDIAILGFGLTAIPLGLGAFAGLTGSSRQLPWESLQAFPVTRPTLFAAEMIAGATEFMTMGEWFAMAGICLGAAIRTPPAAFTLVAILTTGTLLLLATQLLVGSLAQRLSRQVRVMLIALPALALVLFIATPAVIQRLEDGSWTQLGAAAVLAAHWTPAGMALDAALPTAHAGPWAVLAGLAPLMLLTVVVVLAAYFLVSRERDAPRDDENESTGPRLWSFQQPWVGIARLQWETLAHSLAGRASLFMPLLTVVLVRGPLADLTGRGRWLVPTAFAYAGLSSVNLLFNQFGLDRHGVKALMLLPIDELTLLRGKQVGFAVWQFMQALLLCFLLSITGHTDAAPMAAGFTLYLCLFLVLSTIGQFVSIWQPRPLSLAGMRGNRPPLLSALIQMATHVSASSLLVGGAWLLGLWIPGYEWLVLLALAVALAAVSYTTIAPLNARYLQLRREHLVETLGASA